MSTLEQFVYMMADGGPMPLIAAKRIWGIRSGLIRRINTAFSPAARCAFSPNGALFYEVSGAQQWQKYSVIGSEFTLLGTNSYGPGDSRGGPGESFIKYAFRPDGLRYAMVPDAGNELRIYEVNYAGGTDTLLQTLSKPSNTLITNDFGWSADGTKLVCICGTGSINTWVYIKQGDGSYALQQSLDHLVQSNYSKMAMHPSGGWITVKSEFGTDVGHIPFSGNNLSTASSTYQTIYSGFSGGSGVTYSADGTLFGHFNRVFSVSGMSLTFLATVPLAPGTTLLQRNPDFSGDSQIFGFAADGGNPNFVIAKRHAGGTFTPLPLPFQLEAITAPVFNPAATYTL